MTTADHTPTEPPFSDRLLLLRQEQGFVILPNLPFTTIRQLLQNSTKYTLHLTKHHIDTSYVDPPRTFDNLPFHPMLSQSGHCLRKMRTDIRPDHSSKSELDGRPTLPTGIAWQSTSRRRRISPLPPTARSFTLANTGEFSWATTGPTMNSLPTDHDESHAPPRPAGH